MDRVNREFFFDGVACIASCTFTTKYNLGRRGSTGIEFLIGSRLFAVGFSMSTPRQQPEKAMLLMLVAMLVVPGMDAIAKWLSTSISAGQVVWCRFVFQTLLLLPFFLPLRGAMIPGDLLAHAARGLLMVVGTMVFFTALKHLPIADAIAIFFVEPLILTLLAALLLGEKIGWRRLTAVLVGFAGALIVIRPNFEAFGWPAMLPLVSAFTFSLYLIITRTLSQREHPIRMQFYSGISGSVFATLLVGFGVELQWPLFELTAPSGFQWSLLIALGVISTTAHLLVVYAFQRGPAGLLAPFQYIEIIGATIFGLLIFGDFPDALTWVGVMIIVLSGLYVFHRERTVANRGG